MLVFDKQEIRKSLSLDNIFELLELWGGEPVYSPFGILSHTICHNPPGEGSSKLYFYSNSGLFKCYSGCPEDVFDIFELYIKVQKIQEDRDADLNEAVRWIARKFGFSGKEDNAPEEEEIEDWKLFADYDRIQNIEYKINNITLKEYDSEILDRFNYKVKIKPWLDEGIAAGALQRARIGFYPGGDQITIPHYDQDDRFIGLRGRTVVQDEGELYGKYRPLKVNQQFYNHPLGMNLYGLNWSKKNISLMKKAIVFESEKSVLKYASFFGWDNNISVAVCGSNISAYQMELLKKYGAEEIIIAFDKQYETLNSPECKQWKNKLLRIREKYKNDFLISFIWDKTGKLPYKNSPIDMGVTIFLDLLNSRITL